MSSASGLVGQPRILVRPGRRVMAVGWTHGGVLGQHPRRLGRAQLGTLGRPGRARPGRVELQGFSHQQRQGGPGGSGKDGEANQGLSRQGTDMQPEYKGATDLVLSRVVRCSMARHGTIRAALRPHTRQGLASPGKTWLPGQALIGRKAGTGSSHAGIRQGPESIPAPEEDDALTLAEVDRLPVTPEAHTDHRGQCAAVALSDVGSLTHQRLQDALATGAALRRLQSRPALIA